MLAIIVLSLTLVQTHAVDDAPFVNFTFKMDDLEGECKPIKAMNVSADKSKYEGRWYALYTGFSESQAIALLCIGWDSYFDKKGNYHHFSHQYADGKKVHWRHIGVPVDEANGIYDMIDARGLPKTQSKLMNTNFYIDDDIYAYVLYDCLPEQKKHKEQMIIALRRLEDEERVKDKIEAIYKEFEARGGKTLRQRANQENCKYHEKFKKHPYKE